MRRDDWRSAFCGKVPAALLRSWLTEPDSLTARCQRLCRDFRVSVVRQGLGRPLADEAIGSALAQVREVVLVCDGVPVIFAHTTLAADIPGRLTRWLKGLGSRSLGSLLFAYPGFERGGIEFRRLDARDPLYRLAARHGSTGKTLWARRSRHRLGAQEVVVTEVFLPAIERLGQSAR